MQLQQIEGEIPGDVKVLSSPSHLANVEPVNGDVKVLSWYEGSDQSKFDMLTSSKRFYPYSTLKITLTGN